MCKRMCCFYYSSHKIGKKRKMCKLDEDLFILKWGGSYMFLKFIIFITTVIKLCKMEYVGQIGASDIFEIKRKVEEEQ